MGNNVLTLDTVRNLVPSAYAEHASASVSNKYAFIPTGRMIDALISAGWVPTWAAQQKARKEEHKGYQKHLLCFRRQTDVERIQKHMDGQHHFLTEDVVLPEITLTNSHDGLNAYRLFAGLYRLVCSNGLIVSEGTVASIRIRHSGDPEELVEAGFKILGETPKVMQEVQSFIDKALREEERIAFAEEVLRLRYESLEKAPVSPWKLLEARRIQDTHVTIWSTMNRIQENLMKGDQREYGRLVPHIREDGEIEWRRAPKTRPVKSIDETVRLNRQIWSMARALRDGVFNGQAPSNN